ncbi:MAG: glycosyltransferase [Acidobacteriota bacterium]|nr:glycosyltransferase [Acidobacteriota bacterium]
MTKKLSIVIAAWNGTEALRRCLISLEKQVEAAEVEVIAVSNFPAQDLESNSHFSFVRFAFSAETTVPQLRSHGISLAHGEIIALAEDHCLFDKNWCRDIQTAHASNHKAVGGAIENADGSRALDWAVFFYDYGKYMPPNRAGETETLSGFNASYKKEVLDELREIYENGFFETFFNEELKKRGQKLYLTDSAIIYHAKNYELKKTLIQFYHLARSFAAKRISSTLFSRRATFIAASLALPIVLPTRIALNIIKKNRRIKELVCSFPFIILLMSAWSWGEFRGYLGGEGASAGEWK